MKYYSNRIFFCVESGYAAFKVFGYGIRCQKLPIDFVVFSERGKKYLEIFGWQFKVWLRGKP